MITFRDNRAEFYWGYGSPQLRNGLYIGRIDSARTRVTREKPLPYFEPYTLSLLCLVGEAHGHLLVYVGVTNPTDEKKLVKEIGFSPLLAQRRCRVGLVLSGIKQDEPVGNPEGFYGIKQIDLMDIENAESVFL